MREESYEQSGDIKSLLTKTDNVSNKQHHVHKHVLNNTIILQHKFKVNNNTIKGLI